MTEQAHRKAQGGMSTPAVGKGKSFNANGGGRKSAPSVSYPKQRSFSPQGPKKPSSGYMAGSSTYHKPKNTTNMKIG